MNRNVSRIVTVGAAILIVAMLLILVSGGLGDKDEKVPRASGADARKEVIVSDAEADDEAEVDDRTDTQMTVDDPDVSADRQDDDASGEIASTTLEDGSYDAKKEQLLAEVESHGAPVGSNARDASQEQGVLSVAELSALLARRGFPVTDIVVNFDMASNYLGETVLDPSSGQHYPSYQMTYRSSQGVRWVVVFNGGACFAVPLAADSVSLQRQIILSETDIVVQYDGAKGLYSEFDLEGLGDAVGIKVPSIDWPTLESYSAQQLGEM